MSRDTTTIPIAVWVPTCLALLLLVWAFEGEPAPPTAPSASPSASPIAPAPKPASNAAPTPAPPVAPIAPTEEASTRSAPATGAPLVVEAPASAIAAPPPPPTTAPPAAPPIVPPAAPLSAIPDATAGSPPADDAAKPAAELPPSWSWLDAPHGVGGFDDAVEVEALAQLRAPLVESGGRWCATRAGDSSSAARVVVVADAASAAAWPKATPVETIAARVGRDLLPRAARRAGESFVFLLASEPLRRAAFRAPHASWLAVAPAESEPASWPSLLARALLERALAGAPDWWLDGAAGVAGAASREAALVGARPESPLAALFASRRDPDASDPLAASFAAWCLGGDDHLRATWFESAAPRERSLSAEPLADLAARFGASRFEELEARWRAAAFPVATRRG